MVTNEQVVPPNVVLQYNASAVMLPAGQIRIGRGPGCFIRLEDELVSRVHFRITAGDTVVIEDAGSKNGTMVNGELLTGPLTLHDGDEITAGQRVLVVGFINPDEAEEVTPAPQRRKAPTLAGVGPQSQVEVKERCPRCRETVPMQATLCVTCGFEWRRGSRRAPTRREAPVSSSQRRRLKRFPVSLPARFASARWEGQGQILNLSIEGAFITTPWAESVGTRCRVEVRSRQGELITLHGFVRHAIHQGDKGMGIEFTSLSSEAQCWIDQQLPAF